MALNRKYLAAMGVEGEVADQILTEHSAAMGRVRDELDEAKAKAAEYEAVVKELDELKAARSDDDGFKAKYEAEKKAFSEFKADTEAKAAEGEKRSLYRKLLADAGIDAKRIDAVLKVADLSKVSVKDGAIEKADELEKSIRKEWADFIPQSKSEGVNAPNPPSGDSAGAVKSMKEITEMSDASERQAAIAARLKAQEE